MTPRQVLALLSRPPVAYRVELVRVAGGALAAIMLGQSLYWQQIKNDSESKKLGRPVNGAWWFKTRDEWSDELGLTRWEQEAARKKLRARRLIEERRMGVPAKTFFRVNLRVLCQLLENSAVDSEEEDEHKSNEFQSEVVPPTRWRSYRQLDGGGTANKKVVPPPTNTETTAETTTESSSETTEDGYVNKRGVAALEDSDDYGTVISAEDVDDFTSEENTPTAPPVISPRGPLYQGTIVGDWKPVSSQLRPRRKVHYPDSDIVDLWDAFNSARAERWPAFRAPAIKGRSKETGQLRSLRAKYGAETVVRMCRLIVWDWSAIKDSWREAFKCGPMPVLNDLVYLSERLSTALDVGVTSNQHRVSEYRKRFVSPKRRKERGSKGVNLTWND